MYLWLSGDPLTEFKDARAVKPLEWIPFSRHDVHKGTKSEGFGWRLFIRAAHESHVPPHVERIKGIRRHAQVYLDANNFTW